MQRWCVIGAYLLISLTGGSLESILIGAKSIISDTCKPAMRRPRLAVNESVRTFAQFLGFTLSGAFVDTFGAPFVCFMCMSAFFMLTVHCVSLPECRGNSSQQPGSSYLEVMRASMISSSAPVLWLSILGRLSFSAPANLFVWYLIGEPSNTCLLYTSPSPRD